MYKIYVINMEDSVDRRKNISEQLTSLGLKFEFFNAINGKTQPDYPLFKMYSPELSFKYKGQYLSLGQLGCYASHYHLWEKCIKSNENIIVLEDDAEIFPENFSGFIKNLSEITPDIECIRLFDNKRKHFTSTLKKRISLIEIHQFSRGHMSTTGYFLTPNGAKKLIKYSSQWYLPVDIYMDRFWVNHLICYGTVPACITNDKKFDSEIGYVKKKKLTLRGKFNREIFNLLESLKLKFFNSKYYND